MLDSSYASVGTCKSVMSLAPFVLSNKGLSSSFVPNESLEITSNTFLLTYLSCPSVVGRPAAPVVIPAKFTEPTAISAARPRAAAFLNLLINPPIRTLLCKNSFYISVLFK